MRRATLLLLVATGLLSHGGSSGALDAQEAAIETAPATAVAAEGPEVAAVRKTADEFKRAFDAGDAQAIAALWTPGGDYTEADGETLTGRGMIEAAYTEFFKKNPETRIEVAVEAIRVLGPNVAIEEGTAKLIRAGAATETAAGRYSALHVRDQDGWKMASVTEWPTDPALAVSLKDIEWLVGDWEFSSDEDKSARVSYEWDENHAFIRGRYTVKRGAGIESSGTETIARNPAGGLRSWRFEGDGAFAESLWTREGQSWLVETAGTLPDGSEASVIALLTPLDKNSFLWQSTERSVAGVALPGTRPLKVRRAGAANSAEPPATNP